MEVDEEPDGVISCSEVDESQTAVSEKKGSAKQARKQSKRRKSDSEGEGSKPRKAQNTMEKHNKTYIDISSEKPDQQSPEVQITSVEDSTYSYNAGKERQNNSKVAGNPVVVILEPEDANQFFSSTVVVYKLIMNSTIGKSTVIECTRNLQKKIYIIKLQNRTYLSQILSLTELGKFKVKCYFPLSLSQRAGVIGPFGMNTKAEEIVQELKDNGYENVKVERVLKGTGKKATPTTQIKIIFPTKDLPERIVIMQEIFNVRPYIDRPWQCFKCQGFGHNAETG